VPRIGGIPLAKLTAQHVQAMLSDMEAGSSPRMRQLAYAILRTAFSRAGPPPKGLGLLARSPIEGVLPPRVEQTEVKAFTSAQVAAFVDAARDEHFYNLFMLLFGTGARLGEVLGLYWEDVDLKAGVVHFRHTLVEVDSRIVGRGPIKTRKGVRDVKAGPELLEALKDQRLRNFKAGVSNSPFVFPNEDGGGLLQGTVRRAFKRVAKKAGVPDAHPHMTRHTAATALLDSGASVKDAQEQLGHANASTTLNLYARRTEEGAKRAAAILGALVAGKAEGDK
jgi:integrase